MDLCGLLKLAGGARIFTVFEALDRQQVSRDMSSDQNLKISVHESLESLEHVRLEWDALLRDYSYATIFSTYEWLVSWWRAFGANDRLLVLAFRDASSTLVGLAPMALTTCGPFPFRLRLLRLMADGSHDSDNLDLPVKAGFEERFAESLLCFLNSKRRLWDLGELNTLLPHSPGASALRQAFRKRKWVAVEKQTPASAVELPPTWEEYLGRLSSEDQKNLVRYTRRLEKRYAVQIYRCSVESQLPKCLEALFEHHQARWKAAGESGSFGSPERRKFYYELSRSVLRQGRLDLWVLELDGRVVAAQFGFRYGRQVFQLQEGNDPQHATDRVGFVLRGHVIKQLIGDGIQIYDFLGGTLGYKARWGAQPRAYLNVAFARLFSVGAAYTLSLHHASQSKAWLRKHLPPPIWDALHRMNLQFQPTEREDAASRIRSRDPLTSPKDRVAESVARTEENKKS
jgi:CelD/BcsL family acetyltransferase involved in cellulose biosynthesis